MSSQMSRIIFITISQHLTIMNWFFDHWISWFVTATTMKFKSVFLEPTCRHPLYSETSVKRTPIRTFPRVHLMEGVRLIKVVKIAQCLLTNNIQRLLCTVIKLHVLKEGIQSSSSLPFITNFNLFVKAKTLSDFNPYFKDVIQYYYCQFSLVVSP